MNQNRTARYLTFSVLVTLFLLTKAPSSFSSSSPLNNPISINLHTYGSGYSLPLGIEATGVEGDNRLFIIEQLGKIWILDNGQKSFEPFLDISDQVSIEGERGLLGLAFDPNFDQNGFFYVNYTTNEEEKYGDTTVSRFSISSDIDEADPDSEYVILEVPQIEKSHNGGNLAFDSTGNLIIGMGDGGGVGNETLVSQDPTNLLGKMIRINLDGSGLRPVHGCGRIKNYFIPTDNPKPNGEDGWCPEILSSGWRNPWRYSLDPDTGKMWVGDVGEQRFEEINLVPRTTTVLRTYGWPCYEGWATWIDNCTTQSGALITLPTQAYTREDDDGNFLGVSVTGGYVYQGEIFPEFKDHYFFGDFISGNIWSINKANDELEFEMAGGSAAKIASFGLDNSGELFLADYATGEILRVMGEDAVQVRALTPGFTAPGRIVDWGIEVTNLGANPIETMQFTAPIPQDVQWLEGGSVQVGKIVLTFSNIQPGETQTSTWSGLPTGGVGLIENPSYEMFPATFRYLERDNGIAHTIVSNNIVRAYLPAVR